MPTNVAPSVQERAERLLRDQPADDGTAGQRLAFLAAASQLLDEFLDYPSTLAHVARIALPLLGDVCLLDLVDPEGRVRCVDTAHLVPARDAFFARARGLEPTPDGLRTRVLRSGVPLLLPEVDETESEHLSTLRAAGLRSILVVPLVARKVTFGVLTLGITEQDRRFSPADLTLARQLADRAAIAMDNARLLAEERRARALAERTADRLARLQSVTAALSVAATCTQVARVVLEVGADVLEAEAGIFAVVADGGAALEVVASFGLKPPVADGTRIPRAAPVPLAEAVRGGSPVFLDGRPDALACFPGIERFMTVRPGGLVAVPLQVGDRTLGAFQLCFPEGRHPQSIDREFLLALRVAVAQCLDRVRVTEDAFRTEQRFYGLAEMLPQQIWIHARPGNVEYFNERALGYLGISREEALALDEKSFVERFVHPDDQQRVEEAWEAAHRDKGVFEVEVRRRRADGTYRWHLNRAVPIADADGNVVRWFGTATDIEAQKQTEAALERGRLFRERLVGIVGHDLRDPLGVLFMALDLLTDGPRTSEETFVIERMRGTLKRMKRLVGALLDFARSREGGSLPVHRAPVDLGALCREVLDELSLAQPGRQLALDVAGPASGAWDADRLAQVVSNLVGNALQHGDGGHAVHLHVTNTEDTVCLEVHNRGPVIPASELERLFDPYRTAQQPRARRAGSAGLGLYIVREIVLAHGGTVHARSSADEGTVFSVLLPRRG